MTLQGLAESFSADGVPVFVADVKGDLSGIAMPGSPTFKHADKLEERAKELGMDDYAYSDNPAVFWDLYGEQGHPIRTTISEMGPLLLARLLDLNETQEGVLNVVFRFADEQGLLLLDLEDLQAMLSHAAENADELSAKYGNVTKATIGAIQRQLLSLDSQGGAMFFGEPALEINDFIRVDEQGRGMINVLAADKLMRSPKLYATFLLWLLAELFEVLPEVGDPEKPKLVFFFDEAHLLFDDAPERAAGQDRAGRAPDPLEGRGRLFLYAEPDRRAREGRRPARQPGAARAARLHPARPAGDQGGGRNLPHQSRTRRGAGDHRTARSARRWSRRLMEDGAPSVVQRTLIKPPRSRLGPIDAQGARDHPVGQPATTASTTQRSTAKAPRKCSRRRPRTPPQPPRKWPRRAARKSASASARAPASGKRR